MNDNDDDFQTGAQLLTAWDCKTREQKLERACIALMETVNELHTEHKNIDLAEHLTDENISCSCADAYRMGKEALNG